jgi:hypothetical protein
VCIAPAAIHVAIPVPGSVIATGVGESAVAPLPSWPRASSALT